jgi:hypothetical protein
LFHVATVLDFIVHLGWRVAVDVLYRSVDNHLFHDNVQYPANDEIADSDNQNNHPSWNWQTTYENMEQGRILIEYHRWTIKTQFMIQLTGVAGHRATTSQNFTSRFCLISAQAQQN